MRIGVFADAHDHMDNVRRAVREFNRRGCALVVFAGDFVSTFVTPPLRRLRCPLLACFGDNDGNKRGLKNGTSIIGTIAEPPFGFRTSDGTRILVAHMERQFAHDVDGGDIVIFAHTHKPRVRTDETGRLFVNPGETSGWTFRQPTIAIVETDPRSAEIVPLPLLPALPSADGDD